MKSILIPIQDDHENGVNEVGVLRLDAIAHAEQRAVVVQQTRSRIF
ncbi:MAG TPA: hypothetical protein VKU19_22905 [Bryobacteraceae bacterium]|nr:hypothetical protein [Bryobacteraceae bacterium]